MENKEEFEEIPLEDKSKAQSQSDGKDNEVSVKRENVPPKLNSNELGKIKKARDILEPARMSFANLFESDENLISVVKEKISDLHSDLKKLREKQEKMIRNKETDKDSGYLDVIREIERKERVLKI